MTPEFDEVKISWDEEKEIIVKDIAEVSELSAIAKAIAQSVVTEDGDYRPWMREIGYVMLVIEGYTNYSIPEKWNDTDVIGFYESDDYKNIVEWIDKTQFELVNKWIDEMIDVRKMLYFMNPMPGLAALLGGVMNATKTDDDVNKVDSE